MWPAEVYTGVLPFFPPPSRPLSRPFYERKEELPAFSRRFNRRGHISVGKRRSTFSARAVPFMVGLCPARKLFRNYRKKIGIRVNLLETDLVVSMIERRSRSGSYVAFIERVIREYMNAFMEERD